MTSTSNVERQTVNASFGVLRIPVIVPKQGL
jgi:hypothetical protein